MKLSGHRCETCQRRAKRRWMKRGFMLCTKHYTIQILRKKNESEDSQAHS